MRKHAAYRGKNDFILLRELFSTTTSAGQLCKEHRYSYNSALLFPLSQNNKMVRGQRWSDS